MNREALERELPRFLGRQRWYGGKGQEQAVHVASAEELAPALRRVIAVSGTARYQLLLVTRPAGGGAVDAAASVCELPARGGGGGVVVFDALADEAMCLDVLRIAAPSLHARHARPLGAEQSNSSVVYDDAFILKLFRRLASPNPDVEVTVGLWDAGFEHVAEPLGVWRDGDDYALVQRFLSDGTDGWELAVASARTGAGFEAEAAALGTLTGEMHEALARAFGTWPAAPSDWADTALRRVAAARHGCIDRVAAGARVEPVRELGDAGAAIRVHGDYHLGQVLRSRERWYILDFEGEPSRPLTERRAPSCPLRDVAGMLRSFGYAAATAARQGGASADAWERAARDAFLDAYFRRLAGSHLLPSSAGATAALLTAFEVDKAVYEVEYEQHHRPDWVDIPLEGLRALLAQSDA